MYVYHRNRNIDKSIHIEIFFTSFVSFSYVIVFHVDNKTMMIQLLFFVHN